MLVGQYHGTLSVSAVGDDGFGVVGFVFCVPGVVAGQFCSSRGVLALMHMPWAPCCIGGVNNNEGGPASMQKLPATAPHVARCFT